MEQQHSDRNKNVIRMVTDAECCKNIRGITNCVLVSQRGFPRGKRERCILSKENRFFFQVKTKRKDVWGRKHATSKSQ